jgi:HAD superfamily hydrolase (TIGR01549 family)
MAKIQYILCDFWGTLAQLGVYSPVKKIKLTLGLNEIDFSEYVNRMQKVLLANNYTSIREGFIAVAEEFNVAVSDSQLDELVGMWNKSWILARPLPYINENLQKLSKDYKLIVVANCDSKSVSNCLEKFGWSKFFSNVFYSCDIGHIKTDPAFLSKVLESIDASADECVFLGDGVNSDMKPAKSAGITGILIDRRNRQEYGLKIRRIEELGKVIESLE